MGWTCRTCGERDERDDLTFPMMHEHDNVEPDNLTAHIWGRTLGDRA